MRIAAIVTSAIALLGVLALSNQARADSSAPIKLCTGNPAGNYYKAGVRIEQQIRGHVTIIPTNGSLDNLDKVASGACDAGFAQSDAYLVFQKSNPDTQKVERARDMYPEYAHLVCSGDIKSLSDLKRGNTVLVGAPGSGSAVMWESIVTSDPKYKDIATLPLGGTRALSKITDGTEAQCMLFVAGLKSPAMMEANDVAKNSRGNLHLASVADSRLLRLKDPQGHTIYESATIPGGTYPDGLQKSGFFSGGSVKTIQVESVLVGNTSYIESNPHNWDAFLRAVNKALPAINNDVLPHR